MQTAESQQNPATGCHAVIVNYNAGPGLIAAVSSALAADGVEQVLVVDNASTDGSLLRLQQTLGHEPRLRLLKNRGNLGFARACNRAIREIKQAHVLLLNPDCEVPPGAVRAMLDALEESPEAGMVGPLLVNADGSEQAGGRRSVPTPWRTFVRTFGLTRLADRYPRLFSDFLLHREPIPVAAIGVEAISGACMLARREALASVGLLDAKYFMHCEDLDWCMRFRRAGWKILFTPKATVLHHKGVCSRARPIFVEWHKHRGMMRFYKKFFKHQYPGALMWLVAGGVWLRFGALFAIHGVRGMKPRWRNSESMPVCSKTRGEAKNILAIRGHTVATSGITNLQSREPIKRRMFGKS